MVYSPIIVMKCHFHCGKKVFPLIIIIRDRQMSLRNSMNVKQLLGRMEKSPERQLDKQNKD